MSTDDPEISIIIPAYNVESYLPDCLKSIIGQTFNDWELIIADDGSTDDTGKIADQYAGSDIRIKVIHTSNKGVSAARNTCIENAKGRYISFVDADDSLDKDYLNELIACAEKHDADISQCSFSFVNKNGQRSPDPFASDAVFRGEEIMNAYFRGPVGDIRMSVWGKLYKRGLFDDIRFDTGLRVCEDGYYVYECCRKAQTVKSIRSPLYLYNQHEGSTMNNRLPEIYPDYFTVFERQRKDLGGNKKIRNAITKREIENALWLLRIMSLGGNKMQLWDIRKRMLGIAGDVLFSRTPFLIKLKLAGVAVMPHIYFAMLKKRTVSDNEKV